MSKLMRSISGIRGIVGDTLTPQVLSSHVKAFLQITKAKLVVIGRDSRPTGEAIQQFVAGICRLSGVDVIDVGLSTTPSVEILTTHFKADAGIIITASHNPLEWNALKFLNNKGLFLGPDDVKKLFELADQDRFDYPDYRTMGTYKAIPDADGIHIQGTLGIPFVDVEAIRKCKFKVAVDAVNGAGSFIVPRLLEELGCQVVRVIAVDPDADRCALVDGLGQSIGEEYTLAIATEEVLSQKKGSTCVNLSTSRMNEDVAEKFGCTCSRAKVGEINVSLQMIENGCVIGGEGNGGVILPALHYGRDSLVAAALVLSWMAHHQGGPEKFVAENPAYTMPKKKYALGNKSVAEILPQVKKEFAGWKADERDGLWLGKEKSWVHVRASNTEPVIRVIAEAPTAEEAEALCKKVETLIG